MGFRRCTFLALLASLVFVTAGCDWSLYAFGPAHTSFNPAESTISVGNVASLQEARSAPLGSGGGSVVPVTAQGVVYASTDVFPFKIEAFDASRVSGCSGSPKHCAPLWTASVGAAGITSCSGTPKKCTALWSANISGGVPLVTSSFLYASRGQGVAAFDAKGLDGCSRTPTLCKPLWTVAGSDPALANGVLYVSGIAQTFEVSAFDAAGVTDCSGAPKTCRPLWVGNTGIHPDVLPPYSTVPTISSGVVWIGIDNGDEIGNEGAVVGFDAAGTASCSGNPKTCTPIWNAATDGVAYPPAVANNVVYVLSSSYQDEVGMTFRFRVSAFDATACHTTTATCSPLWTAALDSGRSDSRLPMGSCSSAPTPRW